MKFKIRNKGFTLVEALMAIALVAIFASAFFTLFYTSEVAIEISEDQEVATALAREGLEIVENIASDNFLNLVDGSYVLSASGGNYSLASSGTEVIDGIYTRTVSIAPVMRNDASQIDASGDNLDNQTKLISVTVTWNGTMLNSRSIVLQRYVTDWSGISWTQTTKTSFDAGTNNTTSVLESDLSIPDNGKIELENTAGGATYFETVNVYERAKNVDYANNIAYIAVAKVSGGFCTADLTDPENPVELDCVDVDGKGHDVVIDGNYAFLAVDDSNDGLGVVDISDPNDLDYEEGHNVRDSGNRIDIQGNHVYVAVDRSSKSMSIVNISDPDDPFTTATVNAGSKGTAIEVSGNYAYLGLNNGDLKIYDISNPNSPSLESTLDLSSNTLTGAVLSGSYLYVSTEDTTNGLYVVNVADVSNPFSAGSYNFSYYANDVDIYDNFLYVATEHNHGGAVIYDISNPLSLPTPTVVDIQGKANGVKATDGFIYFATDTASQGLAMVTQSTTVLSSSGDFTSSIHDSGSESYDYKSLSWLVSTPPGTSINFQLRSADTSGNITLATFVGPDGTNSSFYSTSPGVITLDPLRTGKRYIQWRAYMTGDGNSTPSLEEVTINYE